jgi:hypothetical protein
MKITVKQLKTLIREAAEEAMAEMNHTVTEGSPVEPVEECGDAKMEEQLQEAVATAFREGYRRGSAAAKAAKPAPAKPAAPAKKK